jgi:predicted dinucleotide-binding enzyme
MGEIMRIAIIGAGNVGQALGGGWSANHDIVYGVPNPHDPKYSALGAVSTNASAAQGAGVVVLCTPWRATQQALAACGDLTGRIVVDCTNPLTADFTALEIGHTFSGAEQVAQWAPTARVCKAMNQIGASLMNHPQLPSAPVMCICGDDAPAKGVTAALVSELGFEAIDAGDLQTARLLEPYGLLWIHLALRRGLGTGFGFGLLRTQP